MFVNKKKLHDAENKISTLNQEINRLNQEIINSQNQQQQLEQQIQSISQSDKYYQDLFNLFQDFGNSMTASQSSLSQLASVMALEKENSSNNASVLSETHQAVLTISSSLATMASDTESTATTVEGLNKSAEDIEGIINLIKNISDQTNLLALNAAIEAARAGEQGRGFAVVADEVRTLAKRTNDATVDIESLVNTIRNETSQAKKQMDLVAADSSNFGKIGNQASEKMDQLVFLSTQMQSIISGSALRSFVEVVKIDHLIYKMEIYKVIFGVSNKSQHDLDNHTNCRLGKWFYQGEGKALFSSLPGFIELEKPHQSVHQYGVEAIELYNSGNKDQTILALKNMEEASLIVLDKLEIIAQAAESE